MPARLLGVVTWVASLLAITFLEANVGNGITIGLEVGMDKIVQLTNVVKRPVLWCLEGDAPPTICGRAAS